MRGGYPARQQNCPNGRGRWASARLASAETVGATGDRRTGATSANPIHAARPRDTVATTRDRVAPGRAAPDIEDVFDLQRLAGNRAVVQLLKRDKRKKALEPDELPTLSKPSQPGPAQGVESPSDIRYAFFFTGGDAFGKAAWRYVEQYYPTHLKREARSFEQVFQILSTEVAQLATSGRRIHIDEIIIVSHANAAGGMKIALTDRDKKRRFTPWELSALQQETRKGLHERFMKTRETALRGIDENTRIAIRGCELGKSQDALDALRILFGGQPYVVAPTAFQGFSIEEIGAAAPRLKTPEMAFDMLVENGYLGQDLKDLPVDEKRAYIKEHFGTDVPTEFFLVGEENYQGLKHLKGPEKLSQAAEQFKERPAEPTIMNLGKVIDHGDRYAGSVNARQRGQEFDALPKAELVSRAEAIVADWQPSQAGLYLRLYEAWTLSTEDMADVAAAPLQRTPAVFADDLLERARMAVFHDPALGPDAFKSTTLAYQKPTGGANANAADFARSEEQAGLLDPTRATVAAGVDLVSADHVRIWGYPTAATELSADGIAAIRAFAADLGSDDTVTITGHTDTVGSPTRNIAVSRDRARAVADLLAELGVSRDRVTPSGAGPTPLLEREAKGPAGDLARAHNRRVEVVRARTSPPTTGQPTVQPTLPTVQRDRWGVGPKRTRGHVDLMGKVPLEGMRLSKFGVGVSDPDANQLRGIKTIATDFLNALKKSPDQRLVIGGHSAKGEDASLAAAPCGGRRGAPPKPQGAGRGHHRRRGLREPHPDGQEAGRATGPSGRDPRDAHDRLPEPGHGRDGRRRARQGRHGERSDRDAGRPQPRRHLEGRHRAGAHHRGAGRAGARGGHRSARCPCRPARRIPRRAREHRGGSRREDHQRLPRRPDPGLRQLLERAPARQDDLPLRRHLAARREDGPLERLHPRRPVQGGAGDEQGREHRDGAVDEDGRGGRPPDEARGLRQAQQVRPIGGQGGRQGRRQCHRRRPTRGRAPDGRRDPGGGEEDQGAVIERAWTAASAGARLLAPNAAPRTAAAR